MFVPGIGVVGATIVAGDGECDRSVVKFVVEEANARLDELINWGAEFDMNKEQLDLGIEGGHSEKRIVHYKDQTGKQIQDVLSTKIKSFPNINLLENHTLVDLITDHHSIEKKGRCYGAYVISQEKEEIVQGVFALKHLCLFTKCTNLCNTIEMYLKNDYPLIICYSVANLGQIKLCLAPQCQNEGNSGNTII